LSISFANISPKYKLRNNTDVIANFVGDNEICEYRPKSVTVKDRPIDINITDILGQKYQ